MNRLDFVLQRYSDNGESTLGLWFQRLDDYLKFQHYTLEDEERQVKVPGETRIAAGLYELKLRQELTPLTQKYRALFPKWFEWHIEIVGVPNFTSIYVHIGTFDTDTNGCILVGDTVGGNATRKGRILESSIAYQRWYIPTLAHLKAGGVAWLNIRNEKRLVGI